jgi:hypothetical protein
MEDGMNHHTRAQVRVASHLHPFPNLARMSIGIS